MNLSPFFFFPLSMLPRRTSRRISQPLLPGRFLFSFRFRGLPVSRGVRAAAILGFLLSAPGLLFAETISGRGCYTYGETETLAAAKAISLALAKRNALEGYEPFAEATAAFTDPQLKNEVLANVTARALKTLKVEEPAEGAEKGEVCRDVEAEVEGEEIREMVAAVANAFRNRKSFARTGLPESEDLRIIGVEEAPCPFAEGQACLRVVVECRRNAFGRINPVRIIWYDPEGKPYYSIKQGVRCVFPRDIETVILRLPSSGFTYRIDLP